MLDDLGAEKTSEWVEETMNLIVNTRYNERRLTIFTSNYDDIPDDTEPNSLAAVRIGFRMRSRLHEMCEFECGSTAPTTASCRPTATRDDICQLWKTRRVAEAAPIAAAEVGGQARAQLKPRERDGKADLKWPGGRRS